MAYKSDKFKEGDKVMWMSHIAPWISELTIQKPGSAPIEDIVRIIWRGKSNYNKTTATVIEIDPTPDKNRYNQIWVKLHLDMIDYGDNGETNLQVPSKPLIGWTTTHCIEHITK